MKKTLLIIGFIISIAGLRAQNHDFLNINNIKAQINSAGDLFTDLPTYTGQFEVPIGSGKTTFYTANLWIGGFDTAGYLHQAAQTYRQTGTDYWQGPMMDSGNYSSAQDSIWNKVWKVNKTTIDSFRLGLFGTPPASIANWPGNGNISLGQAAQLAPYADLNWNNIYEPNLGDYPLIPGDQCIYFIFNDDRGIHSETGGRKLKAEIHAMAYAFNCPDSALWNTVFLHYDIINRSQNIYNNTKAGLWADMDLGYYSDDFTGCDTLLNCYYDYNGDTLDNLPSGYGSHPPAQGIASLTHPMTNYMPYNNDISTHGNPTEDFDYYGYLISEWKDSTHLASGNYAYAGDPITSIGPSEAASGNPPGDRREVGTFVNSTFNAGDTIKLDLAAVFGRDYVGTNLTSINVMKQRIQSVQNDFATNTTPCGTKFGPLSVSSVSSPKPLFTLYPNPAHNDIYISANSSTKNFSYSIYNVLGEVILSGENVSSNLFGIDISRLQSGIYILEMRAGKELQSHKFIKD